MVAPQRIACLDKNHETLFFSYSNTSNSQPLHESHTPLLGALIPLLLSSISVRRYAASLLENDQLGLDDYVEITEDVEGRLHASRVLLMPIKTS